MASNGNTNYWTRGRWTRRGFVKGAGALSTGTAAFALVGCGDDDDDDTPGTGTATATASASGSASASATSTASASATAAPAVKRGGTIKLSANQAPPTLDPRESVGYTIHVPSRYFYSKLFKGSETPDGIGTGYEGDLAESLPEIPDPLQYIVKLRDASWHNLAPLNGRKVTAQDIVAAYEFWVGNEANAVRNNYTSVIDTVQATDEQTVVFRLKSPYSPFVSLLGHWSAGFWILSPEVDPKTTIVGTGPWVVDTSKGGYEPDIKFTMNRSENYFAKGVDGQSLPYLDTLEFNIVRDPNARIAQFTAGQLHVLGGTGLSAKLVAQGASSVRNSVLHTVPSVGLTYGFFDPRAFTEKSTPLADVRVRRAISKAVDREAILQIQFGGKDQGGRATLFPWKFEPWWTDPAGTGLGSAAQWLQYDEAAAKALLTEAGYGDGFDLTLNYTTERFGPDYASGAQAVGNMLGKIGIRVNLNDQPSNTFITNSFVAKFEGLTWSLETPYYDPDDYLFNFFHPQGARRHSLHDDPKVNDLIARGRAELTEEARLPIYKEAEKYVVEEALYLWGINGVQSTALHPDLRGFGLARDGGAGTTYETAWLDA